MDDRERIRATLGNPAWRLRNLYQIINKAGQRVQYAPNELQAQVGAAHQLRLMLLKARQFGFSTDGLLRQFDHTIFNRNVTSCILAHEKDSIQKLFRIVTRAFRFMNPEVRPEIAGQGSKYELYFPQVNSRIYCDLESRSDTIQWLHVSEAAFMDPQRLGATLQAVPMDTGRVTIETTANGMGNHFYDMWTDPASPYRKMFFPWFLFPPYAIDTPPLDRTDEEHSLAEKVQRHYGITLTDAQLMFRRVKKAELKHLGQSFAQEYPEDDQSCFLTSGNPAMDLQLVKELLDSAQPGKPDGDILVWEPYNKAKRYVIGADCAEGVGGDFSSAVVLRQDTGKQVAALHGNWKPYEFAAKLMVLGDTYWTGGRPMPLLAVERNNHGHAVLLALEKIHHYPNLYEHQDEKLGWKTDLVTRPMMLDAFIDGVENKSLHLADPDALRECLTLVNDDGKIQHAEGKHDDRVIAAAIALQMLIRVGRDDLYRGIAERIRV